MVYNGCDTMAEILSTFVYKEDIYLAIYVALTEEIVLYQLLPRGMKDAPKPVVVEYMAYLVAEQQKSTEQQKPKGKLRKKRNVKQ